MKKVILAISSIFLLIAVAIIIYFTIPIKTKQNLKLPSSNSSEIINYLKQKNYNVNFLDTLYLKYFTKPNKGWVYINKKELPRYKFLKQVGAYSNHYTPITIIPGETSYFTLQKLSKKLNLNLKKLAIAYNELAPLKDGNFLAETYNIPIYFKERDTIKFLINSSFKEYKKISLKYFNTYNPNQWKKILIIASIIQKEAANNKEMPLVSSVIFNRLNKKMRLQMDGTLNYGKYSNKKVTPQRIKNDNTSYNTYKYKGIPANPVCNVSKTAILAAIKPADTEYLYFVRNNKGTHNFSKEYKKHLKNIKKRKEFLKK